MALSALRSLAFLVCGLPLALACSRSSDAPAPPSSAKPSPSAPAAAPSASASAVVEATDAAAGPVDLLYETPSTVAVSSRVDNPKDLPEHLVDHRPETAWNGRSGDLVGGFIAFSVPEDAHVTEILMSAGFDKKTEKEDLFEANVRVTKVRLTRAGKTLRDVDLDPTIRTPQRIEVDTAGGKFKIEVLAVKPGTKASWKELAISELVVRGVPGKTRKKKSMAPHMKVGNLDSVVPQAKLFKNADEACSKLVADAKAALAEDKSMPWGGEHNPGEPTCARGAKKLAEPQGDALEVFPLAVNIDYPGPYGTNYTGDVLAFRTAKGVFRTDVRLAGQENAAFSKVDTHVESISWASPGKLVVRVKEHRVTESDGYVEPGHEAEARSEVTTTRVVDCAFGETVECH